MNRVHKHSSRRRACALNGEEFAALVAHEISHEYVWADYQHAMERQDHQKMQELELRCDGIAY